MIEKQSSSKTDFFIPFLLALISTIVLIVILVAYVHKMHQSLKLFESNPAQAERSDVVLSSFRGQPTVGNSACSQQESQLYADPVDAITASASNARGSDNFPDLFIGGLTELEGNSMDEVACGHTTSNIPNRAGKCSAHYVEVPMPYIQGKSESGASTSACQSSTRVNDHTYTVPQKGHAPIEWPSNEEDPYAQPVDSEAAVPPPPLCNAEAALI